MINDEMTIDLKDLFLRVAKKWKFILLWVLICGLVCGAFGAFKNYRNYQAELVAQENAAETDQLAALQKSLGLSDWQVAEVERTAEAYQTLQKEYEDTLYYISNSPTMKMDANSMSYMSIQYGITTDDTVYPVIEAKDYRDAILGALSLKISTNENKQSYAVILSPGGDPAYANELVAAWVDTGKHYLLITLYGETESACEEVAELIEATINREVTNLYETFGEFQLALLSRNYYEDVANKDILTSQQSQLNTLNTLRNAMMTAGTSLSADQKEFYAALMEERLSTEEWEEKNTDSAEPSGFSVIHKKFIAVGLILGIIVSCGWIGLKYIFSKTLRIPCDLKEGFGVPVIGELRTGECGEDTETVNLLASRIYVDCKRNGYQDIFLAGAEQEPAITDLSASLRKVLSAKGLNVQTGDIARCPDAVEGLIRMSAVALLERIDVSRYQDIETECDLCRQSGVQLLGAVVVR